MSLHLLQVVTRGKKIDITVSDIIDFQLQSNLTLLKASQGESDPKAVMLNPFHFCRWMQTHSQAGAGLSVYRRCTIAVLSLSPQKMIFRDWEESPLIPCLLHADQTYWT